MGPDKMQNSFMQNSVRQFKTVVFKQAGCNAGSTEDPIKELLQSKPPRDVADRNYPVITEAARFFPLAQAASRHGGCQ